MKQVSKEEAIKIFESGLWDDWTDLEKCRFQLFQDRLCMPFGEFSGAMSRVLKRPVYTHEFGLNRAGLQKEFLGDADAPTFEQIVNLLPADKTIILDSGDNQ